MATKKKGMDAVIAKAEAAGKSKRKPALKRKGPGIAIMIAVGKPKQGMGKGPMGEKGAMGEKPKGRIAELEARIAELEAKLAEMGDDEEMDESDEGYEDDED